MNDVQSISEAFNCNPEWFKIYEPRNNETCFLPTLIKEIKLEYLESPFDKSFTDYYVGYNFDGKKLFQYLAKSVNVIYKPY